MRRLRGFTLIELVAVLAILGVLAGIALPHAEISTQRRKEQELRRALRKIRDAIDAYKRAADEGRIVLPAGTSGYPPSLDALVAGVEDAKDVRRRKLYFLRRLPRDPMFLGPAVEAAATWANVATPASPMRRRKARMSTMSIPAPWRSV